MDYAALKIELAKPEYGGLSDAAAAQALNGAMVLSAPPFDPIAEDAFYSAVDRLLARGIIDQGHFDELIATHVAATTGRKVPLWSTISWAIATAEDVKIARAS